MAGMMWRYVPVFLFDVIAIWGRAWSLGACLNHQFPFMSVDESSVSRLIPSRTEPSSILPDPSVSSSLALRLCYLAP